MVAAAERNRAMLDGRSRYYTGKPCKRGHVAERQTVNGLCVECRLENVRRNRESEESRERDRVNTRAWRAKRGTRPSERPTYDEVAALLSYDPQTGALTWNHDKRNTRKGAWAGVLTCDGYRRVAINGFTYPASHLAWLLHHGKWPDGLLDHHNRIRDDNSISNLREASPTQNMQNGGGGWKTATSKYRGVHFDKSRRVPSWVVYIRANGKSKYVGIFHDEIEAAKAYDKAARQYHGDFACPNFPEVAPFAA